MVLISGNIPFQTQVASVSIFGQIENDNPAARRRVSVLLLVLALVILLGIGLIQRWGTRHDRLGSRLRFVALGYLALLLVVPGGDGPLAHLRARLRAVLGRRSPARRAARASG